MIPTPCRLAVLALALLPVAAAAQPQPRMPGITAPYVGGSIGGARLDATCPPGSGCDDSDQALRIFGGARFNDTFGAELGWVKLGDFNRGGGETDLKALDLAGTAGIPLGKTASVFAKAGFAYTRSQVTGTAGGLQTGSANGWGPRIGFGVQVALHENWAVRLDADRYRFKLPGGRENVDTLMLGVQYNFR